MDKIHLFIKAVQNFFHAGVHDLVAAIAAFSHNIEYNLGDVGFAIVSAAVAAAEQTGGTAEEKRKAAQQAAIAELTAKGLPVVISSINGAIEAAVAQHNANLAATSSPDSAA